MNDPNKVIDVNISSLLSLKAELLRKQEEVSKAKLKQAADPFVPTRKSTKSDKRDKIKKSEKLEQNENTNNYEEYEDSAILDKSRKVLEAKSRFYDKMASSGGTLNSDDNCLVLFNQKKQDSKPERRESTDSKSSNNSDDHYDDDDVHNADEEWVEYTDCLGRTRKCMKKDLEFFKKKDTQLADNIQPRIELNQNAPMWMIDTQGSNNEIENENRDNMSEMTSIVSKHDQMKINWEKKEEENIYKENVHYQDVLFDEARQHGVGYYAFSTDEEERAKQRKALDELRKKTLAEQKQREAQRTHREKIIAERVKAAKNRQRARLGLPPLEDEPEPIHEKLYDTKEEEKKKKKEEKEKRKKEKEEKLKEEERKKHIRPWDKNKDGVKIIKNGKYLSDSEDEMNDNDDWKYKPEREPMSQEQWNEIKRNERNKEFAPLPEEIPIRSFRSQITVTTSSTSDYSLDRTEDTSLYFTTKKSQQQIKKNKINKEFVKRNYSSINDDEKVRIPIRNELNDDDDDVYDKSSSKRNGGSGCGSVGVEIPPPPTYEYYGPSVTKRSKSSKKPDLEQSIEAGLRFIRDKSDKGILPVKSSWTANASNADC